MDSLPRGVFRRCRALSGLFGTGVITSILCAGYVFLWSTSSRPALIVEEPDRVLRDLLPQHDYDVSFRIHNRTDQPVRIVGAGIT